MVRLREIFLYFLYLGTTGFGGPIALVAYIHRDLVEKKKWISEEEYREGLAMATTLPGPIAFQLGIYCGWIQQKFLGGLVAGIAFIITPFFLCVLLGWTYEKYQFLPWMHSLFYGVSPVVIALIWNACFQLGKKFLVDKKMWLVTFFCFAFALFIKINFIYLLLATGIFGAFSQKAFSKNRLMSLHWPLFVFFFKAGLFIFGSGLVIVPFLREFVVNQYHWLGEQAFLDSISVGMISPGPVLITATFVGFLTERFSGALIATAGIFLPSFLLVFIGAPILRKYRSNLYLQGFVQWISVAVLAVIAATSVSLTQKILIDFFSISIFVISFSVLRWKKIPDPFLVLAGALAGFLWKLG